MSGMTPAIPCATQVVGVTAGGIKAIVGLLGIVEGNLHRSRLDLLPTLSRPPLSPPMRGAEILLPRLLGGTLGGASRIDARGLLIWIPLDFPPLCYGTAVAALLNGLTLLTQANRVQDNLIAGISYLKNLSRTPVAGNYKELTLVPSLVTELEGQLVLNY